MYALVSVSGCDFYYIDQDCWMYGHVIENTKVIQFSYR